MFNNKYVHEKIFPENLTLRAEIDLTYVTMLCQTKTKQRFKDYVAIEIDGINHLTLKKGTLGLGKFINLLILNKYFKLFEYLTRPYKIF